MNKEIQAYNKKLGKVDKAICDLLYKEISTNMPKAENKIWHRHPVWFLAGNPIVGYHKLKAGVRILFWSGQSFEEKGLEKEGTFKAAGMLYTSPEEVNLKDLKRWLKKSTKIQWDYKNIVKNKGKLKNIQA